VAEWLERWSLAPKVLGSKHSLSRDFSINLSVQPAGNRCPILFKAREGEGGDEEEWRPISVTPLPVEVGSLTAWPTLLWDK